MIVKCCEARESRLKYNQEFRLREDVEAGNKPKSDKKDEEGDKANLRGSILKYEKTDFYGRPINPVSPTTATEDIELVSVEQMSTDL